MPTFKKKKKKKKNTTLITLKNIHKGQNGPIMKFKFLIALKLNLNGGQFYKN